MSSQDQQAIIPYTSEREAELTSRVIERLPLAQPPDPSNSSPSLVKVRLLRPSLPFQVDRVSVSTSSFLPALDAEDNDPSAKGEDEDASTRGQAQDLLSARSKKGHRQPCV
jgi:hypothetical protein